MSGQPGAPTRIAWIDIARAFAIFLVFYGR